MDVNLLCWIICFGIYASCTLGVVSGSECQEISLSGSLTYYTHLLGTYVTIDRICEGRHVYTVNSQYLYYAWDMFKWGGGWCVGQNVCNMSSCVLRVETSSKSPDLAPKNWKELHDNIWFTASDLDVDCIGDDHNTSHVLLTGIIVVVGVLVLASISAATYCFKRRTNMAQRHTQQQQMDVSSQSTIYSVGEDTAPQVPTDRPLQPPAYVAEDLPPSYDEAMRQKTQDT